MKKTLTGTLCGKKTEEQLDMPRFQLEISETNKPKAIHLKGPCHYGDVV